MTTRGFRALCVGVLFSALAAGSASALLIDDFSSGSLNFIGGGSNFSLFTDSTMLGGERDEFINNLGAGGLLAGATGSTYSYGALNSAGSAVLTWDGNDDSTSINPTGLGGADFTDGGATTGFRIQFESNDAAAPLTLIVFTSGTAFSSVTFNSPGGIPSGPPVEIFVPFASFIPSGGGADFANVGAFQMQIDGSSDPQLDMTLTFVETTAVPEPGTAVLVSLGLVGVAAHRRRTRGV